MRHQRAQARVRARQVPPPPSSSAPASSPSSSSSSSSSQSGGRKSGGGSMVHPDNADEDDLTRAQARRSDYSDMAGTSPFIRFDGEHDTHGVAWLAFVAVLEWLSLAPMAAFAWLAFDRTQFKSCKAPLRHSGKTHLSEFLRLQALSSTTAFACIGFPVTEVVSSAASFFEGHRSLAEKRPKLHAAAVAHAAFDLLLWALCVAQLVRDARNTQLHAEAQDEAGGARCDAGLLRALRKMAVAQAPVVVYRSAVHLCLPLARWKHDREVAVALAAEEAERHGKGASGLAVGAGLDPAEKAARVQQLAAARARALLDVNFHEYERSFVERRPLGRLAKVTPSSGGAAAKRLAVLEQQINPNGIVAPLQDRDSHEDEGKGRSKRLPADRERSQVGSGTLDHGASLTTGNLLLDGSGGLAGAAEAGAAGAAGGAEEEEEEDGETATRRRLAALKASSSSSSRRPPPSASSGVLAAIGHRASVNASQVSVASTGGGGGEWDGSRIPTARTGRSGGGAPTGSAGLGGSSRPPSRRGGGQSLVVRQGKNSFAL